MYYKLRKTAAVVFAAILVVLVAVSSNRTVRAYIDTNRDTRPAPEKVEYTLSKLNGYELLHETSLLKYYFRDDRDVIAIEDKRTGYVWKTGVDVPFSDELKKNIKNAKTDEEILLASEPKEKSLNTTYIGIANSLVTVEYSELETTKNISSASESGASSRLYKVNDDSSTWMLDVNMELIDLQFKVYIDFGEDSISYRIPADEMTGEGLKMMTAVLLTPFLGASGGEAQFYDPETGKYGDAVSKYMAPGYILVPDGSGSLIRFTDNSTAFTQYIGDVYGPDAATETYYYSESNDAVPIKSPVMPVYGVAHGDRQAAFVAWADQGAEYMDIIVNPEETKKVKYSWVYPRFEYNMTYFQVYNKAGSGYFTLMEEPNRFNVEMTYRFLAGDGSQGYAADYTGMALAYRDHLMANGTLNQLKEASGSDIPMRVDLVMSDVKKSVIGTEQVVATDVDGAREIFEDLKSRGITNINSGLIGWQKGSETLAKPSKFSFTYKLGSKSAFKDLIEDMAKEGIDVSLSRDFTTINKKMVSYYTNSAKHVNTWYMIKDCYAIYPENSPVLELGYALPNKTAEWIKDLGEDAGKISSSFTITGASNTLTSTWDRNGAVINLSEAKAMIESAVAQVADKLTLSLENPNQYLWKYTDRYLQTPVGTSQYVYETDTVPFLEMVLNGTMEMYAPYSNFSFYTDSDILRMIDYNLYPSFVFTYAPSYVLADTPSSDMYSTEYEQYKKLAPGVYKAVNEILKETAGYNWINRSVITSGVIVNTYEQAGKTIETVINYTDEPYTYKGLTLGPVSAGIIK